MKTIYSIFLLLLLTLGACDEHGKETTVPIETSSLEQNKIECLAKMTEHLNAVSTRDLKTLRSTLLPSGEMLLILPKTETIVGVEAFMEYHKEWFQATNWTFTTSVVDAKVGQDLGFVIVESMYREPERNGAPYFNRMTISYDLQKLDGHWYVVKDHATSVEKSTDKE